MHLAGERRRGVKLYLSRNTTCLHLLFRKSEYPITLASLKSQPKRTELTSVSCHVTVYFEWDSCALRVDPVFPVLLSVGEFPDVLAGDSRELKKDEHFLTDRREETWRTDMNPFPRKKN